MADNHVALWAVARIGSLKASRTTAAHGKPFFLATGLHKPHVRAQAMQQPGKNKKKRETEVHTAADKKRTVHALNPAADAARLRVCVCVCCSYRTTIRQSGRLGIPQSRRS